MMYKDYLRIKFGVTLKLKDYLQAENSCVGMEIINL